MKNRRINIISLIWSLPLLVFFFFLFTALCAPNSIHVLLMLKTVGLSFALSSGVSFYYRKFDNIGSSIFLSLVIFTFLGQLPYIGPPLYWLFAIYLLVNEARALDSRFNKKSFKLIFSTTLTLILVQLPYFTLNYSQPNGEVRLATSQEHSDTLYHTAIAAMLKLNHVISHGLHGLGPLEYHFGSHLFMAAASNLGFSTAFQAYNYFFVFLCIPLLGISIIAFSEELLPSRTVLDFYKKLFGYSFIFLGTGVLLGGSLLSRFAIWSSFFESESYTFSLILLMCLFSICFSSKMNDFLRHIIICGLIISLTVAKVSTSFCGLSLIGSWVLLSNEKWWSKKWWIKLFIFFLSIFFFLILFKFINPSMSDATIDPFRFISKYVEFKGPFKLKLCLFIILHFIFPNITILYYLINRRNKEKISSFPSWVVLGITLALIIGLSSVLIFDITGGSAYYFSNVSMFMAIPLLLCIAQKERHFFSKYSKSCSWIFIIFSLIYAPRLIVSGTKHFLAEVTQEVEHTEFSSFIDKLHAIRDDSATKNSVVYIPRTEDLYWKFFDCKGSGYLIPAISQRPALYAWPLKECYPFLCGPRFHSDGLCEKSQESYTDTQLMSEAKRLGYSRIEIVTSKGIRSLRE